MMGLVHFYATFLMKTVTRRKECLPVTSRNQHNPQTRHKGRRVDYTVVLYVCPVACTCTLSIILNNKNILETLVLDCWMEPKACLLHSFLGMETESGRETGSGQKSAACEVHSP